MIAVEEFPYVKFHLDTTSSKTYLTCQACTEHRQPPGPGYVEIKDTLDISFIPDVLPRDFRKVKTIATNHIQQ